ncbi:MAG: hypothetical protein IJ594_07670, partial [Oscillospiraceae bacterium]|nr:hypothetical protein [Oscillospiraceae bacterium]
LFYNDYRKAKSIEASIDFAAKRQVWQRMLQRIIRPMLIARNIWQNSIAVLLRRKAARRKAFWFFAIIYSLYMIAAWAKRTRPRPFPPCSLKSSRKQYNTLCRARKQKADENRAFPPRRDEKTGPPLSQRTGRFGSDQKYFFPLGGLSMAAQAARDR